MILGQDFLSPAIAAMLYPDLFQRVLPLRITFFDRGRWLERGWERAWQNTMHNDRFGKSFLDLWQNPHVYVPALFLNGTSVRSKVVRLLQRYSADYSHVGIVVVDGGIVYVVHADPVAKYSN